MRSVTKYSPTGVGDAADPVAAGMPNNTRPNFVTVIRCSDRSTCTCTFVVCRASPRRAIQPWRRGHT